MKTPYKLFDGNTVELEVSPIIAEALADFEREDDNTARKERWRNEASIDAFFEETGWEPADTTVDIENDYLAREEKEILLAAVGRLSDKQQRLVRLRYYEEKTEHEIAVILGINQSNVHRQLETVQNTLKKYLAKHL